jgi:predicted N-acetyltransferase YhbS
MINVTLDWALSAEEEAQIAGLLRRSFATDFGGRSYFQQRPQLRVMWCEDGQIIGHMAVMLRAIRVGGVLVHAAGLADVATDAGHRGRGIAAALLAEAIGQVRATSAQHFLLFGTAGLYAAHGFVAAQNPITYVDLRDAQTGVVRTKIIHGLRVLPLRGQVWPVDAPVDLLGGLF